MWRSGATARTQRSAPMARSAWRCKLVSPSRALGSVAPQVAAHRVPMGPRAARSRSSARTKSAATGVCASLRTRRRVRRRVRSAVRSRPQRRASRAGDDEGRRRPSLGPRAAPLGSPAASPRLGNPAQSTIGGCSLCRACVGAHPQRNVSYSSATQYRLESAVWISSITQSSPSIMPNSYLVSTRINP